ncbi:MAG: penicillin acylase family protein [Gemmatimonadota bacterium]|nr:penicillin acylase family protein [Gemmatimonadota bacterium]
MFDRMPLHALVLAFTSLAGGPAALAQEAPGEASPRPLPERVEIRRTSYGVPHVLAEDLEAAFYGLAWAHLEDHGARVVHGLVRARGDLARHYGRDSLDSDFRWRRTWNHAAATYERLEPDTRAMFEGYAAGVNRYVVLHPDEFPAWVQPAFTGVDVAARWAEEEIEPAVRRFLRAESGRAAASEGPGPGESDGAEDGSNAWALGPSRTASGHAILLRNPHLNWRAGYYEAHLRVPGVIDFYGDFRVGYPLYFNGGFNRNLGWATTNNSPDIEEIYALTPDPARPGHVLFGGAPVALAADSVTVEYRTEDGTLASETREFLRSPAGPVILSTDTAVYAVKSAEQGRFRYAEQFLKMMRARDLAEWKEAMRIRAQVVSNFTYADRHGHIFYVWNATIPRYPHPTGGDTLAVPAGGPEDVWSAIVPWDSLPQLRDPAGGYLHNENDTFHFTNLAEPFDPADWPPYFPSPRLRLRSQHGLSLVSGRDTLSLEEVVARKHSLRMPLAERTKADLVAAVRAAPPAALVAAARAAAAELADAGGGPAADDGAPETAVAADVEEILAAAALVEAWDATVASHSRGAVLFKTWYGRYFDLVIDEDDPRPFDDRFDDLFAVGWDAARPTDTPRGLAEPAAAARAFAAAVVETRERHGAWDVAWGDVHRFRLGDLDLPGNGCSGTFGCFRVVYWEEAEDGRQMAWSGDAWMLAVEFGETPRARSVLAYGQSSRDDSPHRTDQLEMFARGELKQVAFTEEEIARDLVRAYRPGLARRAGAAPTDALPAAAPPSGPR